MTLRSHGAETIHVERLRQITDEGWTARHDDKHVNGEMIAAAIAYLSCPPDDTPPGCWPWDATWWKPSPDLRRNLVKAGALIAAEIDRIDRLRRDPRAPSESDLAAALSLCLPLLREEAHSLVECCAVLEHDEDGEITPRLPLERDDAAYLAPRLAAIRAAEALVGRPEDGCPAWLDTLIDAAPGEAAP